MQSGADGSVIIKTIKPNPVSKHNVLVLVLQLQKLASRVICAVFNNINYL